MDALATLITGLGSVFTKVTASAPEVLALFTTSTILVLMLGLKFSGAIFGFASRLLHRR